MTRGEEQTSRIYARVDPRLILESNLRVCGSSIVELGVQMRPSFCVTGRTRSRGLNARFGVPDMVSQASI